MYQRIVPRCVSVKALSRAFPALTPTGAEEIRRVMREGYKVPFGEHSSFGVERYLSRVLSVFDLHLPNYVYGVASLYPELPDLYYLNAGDPYTVTLLFNAQCDAWSVGGWGDRWEIQRLPRGD